MFRVRVRDFEYETIPNFKFSRGGGNRGWGGIPGPPPSVWNPDTLIRFHLEKGA